MDYSNHFGLCVKYPKTTNAIKTTNKNKTFHKPKNLNIKNDKTPCCFISYPLHFPPQSQSNHSEIHFPSLYLVFLATKHRHKERERERGTELQSLELSDVRDGNGIRERVWRLLGYNQTRDSTASNLGKSCKFLSNGVQNV